MTKYKLKEQLLMLTAMFSIVAAIASAITVFFLFSVGGSENIYIVGFSAVNVFNFIILVGSFWALNWNWELSKKITYLSYLYTIVNLMAFQYIFGFNILATMSCFILFYYIYKMFRSERASV